MRHIFCIAIVWLLFVATAQVAEVPFVELKGHTDMVMSVAFSPDGKKIVTGSVDKTVRIWDVATGKELHKFDEQFFGFSSDGKRIITAARWSHARIWDVE